MMMQQARQTIKLASGSFSGDKATGWVVWLVGVWATHKLLTEIGVINHGAAIIAAVAIQWVLTRVERRVWLGKIGVAPVFALSIDTASNAAGFFFYVRNFGNTSIWTMYQEATGVQVEFSLTSAVALSVLLGYFVARTPEELWSN